MMTLLLLVMGIHLAACNTILYDDCIVNDEGGVTFSTYNDSVNFRFFADPKKDVLVTITEGKKTGTIQQTFQNLTWMEAVLKLIDQPQLMANKSLYDTTKKTEFTRGTRKLVEIKNADILHGCPQGLPNWELLKDTKDEYKKIPPSGGEDMLILLPTEDTKVTMEVGGKKAVLCKDGNAVKAEGGEQHQRTRCGNLMKGQPVRLRVTRGDADHRIEIVGEDDPLTLKGKGKELKILQENLRGTLNIVQCLDSCSYKGEDDGWIYYGVIACLTILVILLSVAVIFTRGQLQRERRQHQKPLELQEASDTTGVGQTNQLVSQQEHTTTTTTKNGVVDTVNEIYVPFEELWHQ